MTKPSTENRSIAMSLGVVDVGYAARYVQAAFVIMYPHSCVVFAGNCFDSIPRPMLLLLSMLSS